MKNRLNNRLINRLLVLALFLVPISAFANLDDEFAAVKDSGRDFTIVGTVCEEVARHQLQSDYPTKDFTVETGIAYGDNARTIGELDVIVFRNATHEVAEITEVKCWSNQGGAIKKARDQRQRFLTAIRDRKDLQFHSTSTHQQYSADVFRGVTVFKTLAQKGSKAYGFDRELDYSLDEMMGLRARVMQCQASGTCAAKTE